MVDELNHFNDKVLTFEKIQNLVPVYQKSQEKAASEMVQSIDIQNIEVADEVDQPRFGVQEPQSAKVDRSKKPLTMM